MRLNELEAVVGTEHNMRHVIEGGVELSPEEGERGTELRKRGEAQSDRFGLCFTTGGRGRRRRRRGRRRGRRISVGKRTDQVEEALALEGVELDVVVEQGTRRVEDMRAVRKRALRTEGTLSTTDTAALVIRDTYS